VPAKIFLDPLDPVIELIIRKINDCVAPFVKFERDAPLLRTKSKLANDCVEERRFDDRNAGQQI
jgi:hypothetical protein